MDDVGIVRYKLSIQNNMYGHPIAAVLDNASNLTERRGRRSLPCLVMIHLIHLSAGFPILRRYAPAPLPKEPMPSATV